MKPPFAYLSPSGAAFVAAIGISLAVFPLAGVGVQVEPAPVLPAIGAAVQRVAAALPLAVAVWAFGGLAAKRERNNADQQLVRELNSAASVYATLSRDARRTAGRLARSRRVARALAGRDERRLRAIERAHPWIG